MKDPRDIIIRPVVSEKSYALIEQDVYTFEVHPDATKPEIHDAVQEIWGVKVLRVNTLNRKGKKTRARRSNRPGSTSDTKRALVTLAGDDRIGKNSTCPKCRTKFPVRPANEPAEIANELEDTEDDGLSTCSSASFATNPMRPEVRFVDFHFPREGRLALTFLGKTSPHPKEDGVH